MKTDDQDMKESAPLDMRPTRRTFLSNAASLAMLGGLAAGYGAFSVIIGRFLYPLSDGRAAWMFVTDLGRMRSGDSLSYRTPAGAAVMVTRHTEERDASAFIALSSTCPHLGCQVHWEAHRNRFFCPCHNGVFDPTGKAVSGPPAEAGQSLPRYPLKVEGGLLFIELPTDSLARAASPTGTAEDGAPGQPPPVTRCA